MSTTKDLVSVIKKELKDANMTYADLAHGLNMSESSVKRMLAKSDMSLSRIDEICGILRLDFAELARRVANTEVLLQELTHEQESAVVADRKLLLVAICTMSLWSKEQIMKEYDYTEPEVIKCLVQLDKIGIIELRPLNRYRLLLAKTFRWKPDGPVMRFFRKNALQEYFAGNFNEEHEVLTLVHGKVNKAAASAFKERIQKLAQDFSQQHATDQKLDMKEKCGLTLVLGSRQWEFSAFTALRREKN